MIDPFAKPLNQRLQHDLRSSGGQAASLAPDVLLGDSTRGVRLLLEYTKVEEALRASGIGSTIVVFGSARVHASGPEWHKVWYQQTRTFARIASERGGALQIQDGSRENVIATGGGPGLMEAANRGAHEAGAPSIGFNIGLPLEQKANQSSSPELTFRFHYFAIRKLHLAMRANALVVFPGGFGTLDELFELLTLKQTGKAAPIPILLFDEDYWRKVLNFDHLLNMGMVDEHDLSIFQYASEPEMAWSLLEGHLLSPHADAR